MEKIVVNKHKQYDALIAAPDTHTLLFENENVRVLKLKLTPGQKENLHMHPWKSVMICEIGIRAKYHNDKGEVVFEQHVPAGVYWLEPEGLHGVENVDNKTFYGYRIEIKK